MGMISRVELVVFLQVGAAYTPLPLVESVGPVFDPRSPTPGITRTPMRGK